MSELKLDNLRSVVAEKIKPFIHDILSGYSENIHSIYVIGSSLTEDFDEKTSDINSIVVLNDMDLKFIEFIAPLGKRYKKKRLAAPLIMTPDYIARSRDVFPIEFYDFNLIHETVYGEDILRDILIDKNDLRHQCERELKSKLIGLRQGYISSLGDRNILTERIVTSFAGYMPLFRGIIFLMGKEPPTGKYDVIFNLAAATGIDTEVFKKIIDVKKGILKPGKYELNSIFEKYYATTEEIGKIIDELQV
jgi:predicted nucleotidyltransferase